MSTAVGSVKNEGHDLLTLIDTLFPVSTMPNASSQLDLSYCTLALLLSARIHGPYEAVRATARRCVKQLPKRQRDLM